MSTQTHGSTDGERDYVRVSSDDTLIHLGGSRDGVSGAVSGKICCVCGEDVDGKPRMKDHAGQYWCYECGMADQQKKQQSLAGATAVHAAAKPTCAECRQTTTPEKLSDFNGRQLCAGCIEKLEKAARREAARLAAAEEEALRMARNHRILIICITIFAIAAVALAVWQLMRA